MFAAGLVTISTGERAYPEVPDSTSLSAEQSQFGGMSPTVRSQLAFGLKWAADGLDPEDGATAQPVVFFAWANTTQPKSDAQVVASLPFTLSNSPSFAFDPQGLSGDLLVGAESAAQLRCLASAVYFEARGEDKLGRMAVAQVVLNRVKDPAYPKTICGVVYQNASDFRRCQFSFACDGVTDRIVDKGSWTDAMNIAEEAIQDGGLLVAAIGNSTSYHNTSVSPDWSHTMRRVDTIGHHIFYASVAG